MYLIYHDNSCETGRALARALGIESGHHLPERRFRKVIRWGNREKVRYAPEKTLNKRTAMDVASNKDTALRFMREHSIPSPPLRERFEGKLLIGRKPSHQHGSGAFFITSQVDFDLAKRIGCNHFMEFVPSKREFRVHVFGGEAIFVYERVCPRDPKTLQIKNDWDERKVEIRDTPREIIDTAIGCVREMELDFGAVDIALSVNNRPYIFEVNTAPGLVNDDGSHKPSFRAYEQKMREWLSR